MCATGMECVSSLQIRGNSGHCLPCCSFPARPGNEKSLSLKCEFTVARGGAGGGVDAERLQQSELSCWLLWWGRQGEPPLPPHAHRAEGHAESQLYLINPLAKFSFSRALFPASSSDLPGPCHLSNAHHHSHHAISPPPDPKILFFLSFSPSLSPLPTSPKEPVFRSLC